MDRAIVPLSLRTSIRATVERLFARLRFRLVQRGQDWRKALHRRWGFVETLLWFLTAVFFSVLASTAQPTFAAAFADATRLEVLKDILVALGGALTGGAAIAASFILFAMQVNVTRMPYGLFRRLSTDAPLLGAMGATFPLAITIASLAIVATPSNAAFVSLAALLATAMVLRLFYLSYARSLDLISPARQLDALLGDVRHSLRVWDRRRRWSLPIWKGEQPENVKQDVRRLAWQHLNPSWTQDVRKGLRYAAAVARRAQELGDVEASGMALSALVAVNRLYVDAKGRTFFASNGLIENPMVGDAVVSESLEQLKLLSRAALGRRDEEQLTQVLAAYRQLAVVYLVIDYGDDHASRTHALLAAAYLQNDVEALASSQLVDAMMNGVREMGAVAVAFVGEARPEENSGLVETIARMGLVGAVRSDHRPITLTASEQLAHVAFALVTGTDHDIRHAAREVRDRSTALASYFLNTPDTLLASAHSTYLGPIFSSTSPTSLRHRLESLVNTIADRPKGDRQARRVLRNLAVWADGLHASQKELLLLAIEKRSHFSFDMIHWIQGLTTVFVAASSCVACDRATAGQLRKHARWLALVLGWIPRDPETVQFVEAFGVTDALLQVAADMAARDFPELADEIERLMVQWTLEAGAFPTGWAILERGIYGLAALGLARNRVRAAKDQFAKALEGRIMPDLEARNAAAREIRAKAETLDRRHFEFRSIARMLGRLDARKLRKSLRDYAGILSPGTKGEPVRDSL